MFIFFVALECSTNHDRGGQFRVAVATVTTIIAPVSLGLRSLLGWPRLPNCATAYDPGTRVWHIERPPV
jgi:hypothetical protein